MINQLQRHLKHREVWSYSSLIFNSSPSTWFRLRYSLWLPYLLNISTWLSYPRPGPCGWVISPLISFNMHINTSYVSLTVTNHLSLSSLQRWSRRPSLSFAPTRSSTTCGSSRSCRPASPSKRISSTRWLRFFHHVGAFSWWHNSEVAFELLIQPIWVRFLCQPVKKDTWCRWQLAADAI